MKRKKITAGFKKDLWLRKTGIKIVGDVPWGTHFCQFYQTKKDLLDMLVPYFEAGLKSGEFCMWVACEPLNTGDIKTAMRHAVPGFAEYVKKGQIEILDYTGWYVKDGVFDSRRVLDGWVKKLKITLSKGYEGLRLSGNTFWLEKKDRKNFTDYEEAVNAVIGRYKIPALCTYSLSKCGHLELIDVVRNHRFALIKRQDKWESIETLSRKEAEKEAERFAAFPKLNPQPVTETDILGGIHYLNPASEKLFFESKENGLGGAYLSDVNSVPEIFKKDKTHPVIREVNVGEKWFSQFFSMKKTAVRYECMASILPNAKKPERF